jgi:hypothetical protein
LYIFDLQAKESKYIGEILCFILVPLNYSRTIFELQLIADFPNKVSMARATYAICVTVYVSISQGCSIVFSSQKFIDHNVFMTTTSRGTVGCGYDRPLCRKKTERRFYPKAITLTYFNDGLLFFFAQSTKLKELSA